MSDDQFLRKSWKPMPNANTATGKKTALKDRYACITMIDVKEGDCYVVDVRHGSRSDDPTCWNRYLFDTGKPHDKPARPDTITTALFGADDALATADIMKLNRIKDKYRLVALGPPWASAKPPSPSSGPNIPIVSGVVLTHSDDDHCGWADVVLNRLRTVKDSDAPCNNDDQLPIPVYLSPMHQWTDKVILKTAEHFDRKEPKQWGFLDAFCQFEFTPVFVNKTLVDLQMKVVINEADSNTLSVEKTWTNLKDLAAQARYHLVYRFNYVDKVDSANDVKETFAPVDFKRIQTAYGDGQVVETDFKSSAFRSLSLLGKKRDDKSEQPTGKLSDRLNLKERILVEVGLKPFKDGVSVKRSFATGQDDTLLSGRWLRHAISVEELMAQCPSDPTASQIEIEDEGGDGKKPDDKDEELGDVLPPVRFGPQIPSLIAMQEEDDPLANDTVKRSKETPGAEESFKISVKPANVMDFTASSYPGDDAPVAINEEEKFATEFHVIGLKNQPMAFLPALEDPSDQMASGNKDQTEGRYANSRLGCAGSRFVEDFNHMIMQYHLPLNAEAAKKKTAKDKDTQVVDKDADRDKDSVDPDVGRLNAVNQALAKLKSGRPTHPNIWGEYANRASIITHFVYCSQPTSGYVYPKRRPGTGDFNMLFTGDAYESGRSEDPYTKERVFNLGSRRVPWVASPEELEYHRPDGNIMSWLWSQKLLVSLRVDVLKVPHHGSSGTTGSQFFRYVSASVYLISASATPHSHPRAETLETIVSTILQEDGGALPPSKYRCDTDPRDGRPHIKTRPRPRLIFLTHQANFSLRERRERADEKVRPALKAEYNTMIQQLTNTLNGLNDKWGQIGQEVDANKKLDARVKTAEKTKLRKPVNEQIKAVRAQIDAGFEDELQKPPPKRNGPVKEEDKVLSEKYKERVDQLMNGAPEKPEFKSPFKYDVFATDWLRDECVYLRDNGDKLPMANVRIFYQAHKNAATRLRFGRDWYRPDEVRCEWHAEDWIEMRYEWDIDDKEKAKKWEDWKAKNPNDIGTDKEPALYKPLKDKYANPANDPLAYPYPEQDEWEYPVGPNQAEVPFSPVTVPKPFDNLLGAADNLDLPSLDFFGLDFDNFDPLSQGSRPKLTKNVRLRYNITMAQWKLIVSGRATGAQLRQINQNYQRSKTAEAEFCGNPLKQVKGENPIINNIDNDEDDEFK